MAVYLPHNPADKDNKDKKNESENERRAKQIGNYQNSNEIIDKWLHSPANPNGNIQAATANGISLSTP